MLTLLRGTHRDTPFSLIERLQAGIADQATALEALFQRLGPVVLIPTCNRFELYVSGDPALDCLFDAVSGVTGVPVVDIRANLQVAQGIDAAEHLYEVASGIDSLSLGEYEVLGQVRNAFSRAISAGTDDELLAHVFHGAVRIGRRLRAETSIARHSLSISSIAAIQATEVFPALEERSVLVIGAGEAGRLAARALHERGARDITILNRTVERARQVADAVGGQGAGLDCLPTELAGADIVVTATAATAHVIDEDTVAKAMLGRRERELLLIDIAMPRDVAPAAAAWSGVRYWGIEDLRSISQQNACQRAAALPEARAILTEALDKLESWMAARDVIPTIRALTAHAEAIRHAQVELAVRQMSLSPDDREQIELMTRSIVKRLLHVPIAVLREGTGEDDHTDAVRKLFGLSRA